MRTIVSKFGGSSTANAGQLRRILGIVRQSPARRCVVLSAPGIDAEHDEKVTSLLARCWQCRKDSRQSEGIARHIAARFTKIAGALGVRFPADEIEGEILRSLERSMAHTLSRGEYLCASLFSKYSEIPMVDAAELVAFDASGALDEAQTYRQFLAASRACERMIVPGFYGADSRGRVHTFPRNGSDISGALAAAGVEAGLYENWTDVPGLMSADPELVPGARLIPQVGYRQMRALSRAGAQVLHPDCLDPVALAGIPTRLRCLNMPDCFGTLIDEQVERTAFCVVGQRSAAFPEEADPSARAAARVSVFGAPRGRVEAAAAELPVVGLASHEDCTQVYVERDAYERSVRLLHRRLMD